MTENNKDQIRNQYNRKKENNNEMNETESVSRDQLTDKTLVARISKK